MSQTVEIDLGKILERIEQKLDKHIETTNQRFDSIQKELTDIKVNQARLDGKMENLQSGQARLEAKTENLQAGQDSINTKLDNKLNTQNTWLLSLLTGLIIGVLTLVGAVGKVVFFPNL